MTTTTATYQTENRWGELVAACAALAPDLARELGAKVREGHYTEQDDRALLDMPDGLQIYISNQKGRASFSASAPRAWVDFLGYSAVTGAPFGDCTCDPSRGLAAMVRDVQRKVIDASAEPLAKWRAEYDRQSAITDKAEALCARWAKAMPKVRFWPGRDRRQSWDTARKPAHCVSFSCYEGGASFAGHAYIEGGFYFDSLTLTGPAGASLLKRLAPL